MRGDGQASSRANAEPLLATDGMALSKQHPLQLALVVGVVSLGSSLQFGFGTGALNNLEQIAPASLSSAGHPLSLLCWSLIVSGFGIGGLAGSMLAGGFLSTLFGRKSVLLVSNVFVIASCLLMMVATNWWLLLLARIMIGLVAGITTCVVPMYFAEISPRRFRTLVGTAHQLAITFGILLSQVLTTPSLHLFGSDEGWRYTFVVPLAFALLELAVLPFCPDSPAHVLRTQGSEQALHLLGMLHRSSSIPQMLSMLRAEVSAGRSQRLSLLQLFRAQHLRKQLVVGVVIQLSMQLSGIDAVFYYSTLVFRTAQVPNPEMATLALGVTNLIMTFVAIAMMEQAGRRSLLLFSWVGMCIAYLLAALSFVAKEVWGYDSAAMLGLSVIAMVGVIVAFSVGPGCIAWLVIAEIFPMESREAALALGVTLNWIANWLVAFTFPMVHSLLGPYTLLLFAFTTGMFALFTWCIVPETKSRTGLEIAKAFEGS